MFELKKVSKRYGNDIILSDITYTFKEGNIYIIRGANGSGKSTLFKIITGIINKSSGYITKNKIISYLPDKYVLPGLIKPKTYLNLIFGDYKLVNKLINLYKVEDRLIFNLSKGNKQKLGIISKTYINSDIYIYDEAVDGLDNTTKNVFLEKLLELKKNNKIIILSLHEDINESLLKPINLCIRDGILYEA